VYIGIEGSRIHLYIRQLKSKHNADGVMLRVLVRHPGYFTRIPLKYEGMPIEYINSPYL
jgi:hypothetical protein